MIDLCYEDYKISYISLSLSQQVLVNKVAESSVEEREQEINKVADMADVYLKSGKDTLILTSRQLLVGKSESSSIDIFLSFPPKIGYRSQCFITSIIFDFQSVMKDNCNLKIYFRCCL